jgi:hypothetical protein
MLRVVGWAGAALVVSTAVLGADPLFYSVSARGTDLALALADGLAALGLLVAGVGTSAAVARVTGREVRASIGGAGLRDPFLAIALASVISSPDSTGVPLLYGVFCLGLAALALRVR